jgi:hypothetical protein
MNYHCKFSGGIMKQESKKIFLFISLVFVVSILLSACDEPSGGWEYHFDNESSYGVSITLNKKYKFNRDTKDVEYPTYSTAILLSSHSSVLVYIEDDSVDFSWTASSVAENRNLYIVEGGSRITFKDRTK